MEGSRMGARTRPLTWFYSDLFSRTLLFKAELMTKPELCNRPLACDSALRSDNSAGGSIKGQVGFSRIRSFPLYDCH